MSTKQLPTWVWILCAALGLTVTSQLWLCSQPSDPGTAPQTQFPTPPPPLPTPTVKPSASPQPQQYGFPTPPPPLPTPTVKPSASPTPENLAQSLHQTAVTTFLQTLTQAGIPLHHQAVLAITPNGNILANYQAKQASPAPLMASLIHQVDWLRHHELHDYLELDASGWGALRSSDQPGSLVMPLQDILFEHNLTHRPVALANGAGYLAADTTAHIPAMTLASLLQNLIRESGSLSTIFPEAGVGTSPLSQRFLPLGTVAKAGSDGRTNLALVGQLPNGLIFVLLNQGERAEDLTILRQAQDRLLRDFMLL
ncbi:MAG: hypothetical protein NW237_10355 [Cyanobacteriota bacterium]|nr:hypothetical protein [Cyanobacteriota bacterium]